MQSLTFEVDCLCLQIGKMISSHNQHHLLYKGVHPQTLISITIILMFKHRGSGKEGENCSIKWRAIREIIGNFTSLERNNGFVELDRQSSTFQLGMRLLTRKTEGTSWEETEAWETRWRAMKGTGLTVSMLGLAELIRWGVWWVLIAG